MSIASSTSDAETKPRQGPHVEILARLDLGSEIPALAGKELRLQVTTYMPGTANQPHSHADKPETVVAIAGEVTEYHRDGRVVVYRPGDTFTADKDTFHHMGNTGGVPGQLIVAMICDKPR
jgi:quercetin dioxygenase-like cupin family protein